MFKVIIITTVIVAVYGQMPPISPADLMKGQAEFLKAKDQMCKHDITGPEEEAFKCFTDKAMKVSQSSN